MDVQVVDRSEETAKSLRKDYERLQRLKTDEKLSVPDEMVSTLMPAIVELAELMRDSNNAILDFAETVEPSDSLLFKDDSELILGILGAYMETLKSQENPDERIQTAINLVGTAIARVEEITVEEGEE